jgi:hypothetical protein
MNKHTKGPWKVNVYGESIQTINGKTVCELTEANGDRPQYTSDRIISNALLEALLEANIDISFKALIRPVVKCAKEGSNE